MACHTSMAFVTNPTSAGRATQLKAANNNNIQEIAEKVGKFATTAAIAISASPLVALAQEVDADYEYGAVDAPIGIAVGGGVLAILTAAVPLAMQGGEEAFEEMKERDAGKWRKGGR